MRVADYIAQRIAATGTDCFFMVAGGMAMHLNDAFGRISTWTYYCNHHEQASAMAAEAYARETGKIGVCLVTSGPGATNVLTGLVGAYQDSVPMIVLTGQCKSTETIQGRGAIGLRQWGFLEVDIVPIVASVTKYSAFVHDVNSVRNHLETALELAVSGRPGPVLLDIPLDVQGALMPDSVAHWERMVAPTEPAGETDLDHVLEILANARRPIILAGHGIRAAGAADVFHEFIENTQTPVVTTMMAKDLIAAEHPLFVGHCGPRGERRANFAIQSADVVLMIGSSLHVQTIGYETDLFAPTAFKIQIDIDKAILDKRVHGVNEMFKWDITEYLPRMARKTMTRQRHAPVGWLNACRFWKHTYSVRTEPHMFGTMDDRVNLYEFVDRLSDLLNGTETIITDAGQPHPILGQAFRVKGQQRYLNPGSLAEMGYALPAAFGPAAADRTKNIIVVTGDGSFQTNIQELQTLKHYNFNVKVFVVNNDGYASIKKTQENFFQSFYVGSTEQTGISFPDTQKICGAYGIKYSKCNNRRELDDVLKDVLCQIGPVVCEIMAQTDQRIMPVVPSQLLPDGKMRSKSLDEMVPSIGVELARAQELAGLLFV